MRRSLCLGLLFVPVLGLGCAKGATLGNVGGAGGFGGAGQVTNANGPGTTNSGNTSNNVGPTTNNGPTATDASATNATNGPTTDATTTNAATTDAATTAVASTTQAATVATVGPATSTSSGPTNCDPENPGPGCGANQHCVALASGSPLCQPAGSGSDYATCTTRANCQPQDECANGGGGGCCLAWCNYLLNDCLSGFDSCTELNPPVYVNGVEYGVCYDGITPC